MSRISRRTFLKSTAIGVAGIASMGVLGACGADNDSKDKKENKKSQVTHNPVRTEKCDLVVVGSGTAGLCAAVRGAELGGSVILLEKRSQAGGTSVFAEGIGGLNSYMHKSQGLKFDPNEAAHKCAEFHHWGADYPCLQRFISESGKTIDWLHENCGIEFWQATVVAPTSYPSWHLGATKDGNFAFLGESLIKPLVEYGKKKGLDFRVSNPATGLIYKDGKVKGVYVKDKKKNEEYAIEAKAVVLATGGYANNKQLFEKLTGLDFDEILNYGQSEGRDGDGIQWAKEIGAALHFPGTVMFGFPAVTGVKDFLEEVNFLFSLQPTLRVNERGLRFFNEEHHTDFGQTGNTLIAQTKVFSLMDQAYLDHIQKKSVLTGYDLGGYPSGKPWAKAAEVMKNAIENKQAYKFDSVEELATHIGCEAKTLQETLDKYNEACDKGKDVEFNKSAKYLLPLRKAPYYAAQLKQSMFTTVGGLRVDEYWRVTDTEGKPISGLFALGNDASSIYGHDYDVGIMSGSQQGWCATGGRLVAEYVMGK